MVTTRGTRGGGAAAGAAGETNIGSPTTNTTATPTHEPMNNNEKLEEDELTRRMKTTTIPSSSSPSSSSSLLLSPTRVSLTTVALLAERRSQVDSVSFKESVELLSREETKLVCESIKQKAFEVTQNNNTINGDGGGVLRSRNKVNTMTQLATLSRDLIRYKREETQGGGGGGDLKKKWNKKSEWLGELHQAAAAMHNEVLLHTPSYDDDGEADMEEGDQVADTDTVHECENAVASLCEAWIYECDADTQGHVLAARTLPWLLVQALTRTDQTIWCKRAARFALQTTDLFDWCDDSATSLKRLFLRALFCPPFVRSAQGRKMLSRCFTFDPDFSQEMIAVIKNQLLAGRNSLAEHYGDVIFGAWKQLSPTTSTSSQANKKNAQQNRQHGEGGDPGQSTDRAALEARCLLVLENELVPGLVHSCLHARTFKLSDMLRRLLRAMLYQNRTKLIACEEIIRTTHEPLIFRALAACNAQVRRNACALITECFPLMHTKDASNRNRTQAEWKALNERLLAKQLDAFHSLLSDSCCEVRMLAATSVGHVLRDHWDSLPAVTVVKLVNQIVDLSHDVGSVAVRTKALQGLAMLMDCVHAQDALRKALPSVLSSHIHDPSSRVRLQCLQILLQLHLQVRGIVPFYEAVEVTQLLELLAKDKEQEVKVKVSKLLLSSYIPSEEEGASFIMALLQQQPQAGRGFCLHARQAGCEPSTIATIIYELVTHLVYASDSTSNKASKRRARNRDEDQEEEEGHESSALESEVWCNVMQGISNLVRSLLVRPSARKRSQAHSEDVEIAFDVLKKLDKDHSGSALHKLYQLAPSQHAKAIVINLASLLPLKHCGQLAKKCKKVCSLAGVRGDVGDVGLEAAASIRALCCWGLSSDLITTMMSHLTPSGSKSPDESENAGGATPDAKRICRRMSYDWEEESIPLLAHLIELLACVLSREEARQEFLQEDSCENLVDSLKIFTTEYVLAEGRLTTPEDQSFTKKCVMVLCKLALHYSNATGATEVAGSVLQDVSKQTLVCMEGITTEGNEESKVAFLQVIEALTALSSDALLLNIFSELAHVESAIEFARKVNAFAMTLVEDGEHGAGRVLTGFEHQMKRLIPLLLSESRSQESFAIIEECLTSDLSTLADFDRVFQKLLQIS